MRRREIVKVILMPQLVLAMLASLICALFFGKAGAHAGFVGGVIVMIGSGVSGFVALGPNFNNPNLAFAKVFIGEMLKIFVIGYLLTKVFAAAKIPPLAVIIGTGFTLLGSFFGFGLLQDQITPEMIERAKELRLEEERLERERSGKDSWGDDVPQDDWKD